MFVLCSDITIGNFRISGVNEVRITRSIHSIADSAVIKLPSIAKILKDGKVMPADVITGKQFKDGDQVTIRLGYNQEFNTEFDGFVTRRNMSMPLEIVCEGYSWLLRRNPISEFLVETSVKEILKIAVGQADSNYKIEVECDVDLQLSNVFINNSCGFDLINDLIKYTDGSLSCFFIRPNVLWCGFVFASYAKGDSEVSKEAVKYRLGFNAIKDNHLKQRDVKQHPIEVMYYKRMAGGEKIAVNSDVFKDAKITHGKLLNHAGSKGDLEQMAEEKAYRLNYDGYEGSIEAFLQPYAEPGYQAYISDGRYPELDGNYLIESTEVYFGVNGARRILELGPRQGFKQTIK